MPERDTWEETQGRRHRGGDTGEETQGRRHRGGHQDGQCAWGMGKQWQASSGRGESSTTQIRVQRREEKQREKSSSIIKPNYAVIRFGRNVTGTALCARAARLPVVMWIKGELFLVLRT